MKQLDVNSGRIQTELWIVTVDQDDDGDLNISIETLDGGKIECVREESSGSDEHDLYLRYINAGVPGDGTSD